MKTKKTYFLTLSFLLMITLTSAQLIELEVIAPYGDLLQGSNGMDLHCTIGEPIVERFDNGEILDQGFHQVFDLATPIFELPDMDIELKVYPNPATDWIAIESSETIPLALRLLDTNGRILYQSKMADSRETLDVSSLPAGSYYLNVSLKDQLMQTFIIQKIK